MCIFMFTWCSQAQFFSLEMLKVNEVTSLAQVAVSTNKEVDAHIPNYTSLPPQLICQLHNMTMHVRIAYLF